MDPARVAPLPPAVSPDGRFWLDDDACVPFAASPAAPDLGPPLARLLATYVLATTVFPFVLALAVVGAREVAPAALDLTVTIGVGLAVTAGLFVLLRRLR